VGWQQECDITCVGMPQEKSVADEEDWPRRLGGRKQRSKEVKMEELGEPKTHPHESMVVTLREARNLPSAETARLYRGMRG
jgi:hypothetical protein